jgi:hypothetical protein
MQPSTAKTAVIAITAFNLLLVGASSLLAVHGDGGHDSIVVVLALGVLWVLAFAARAATLLRRGDHAGAVDFNAKCLVYGLLVVAVLIPLALVIRDGVW